MAAKPVKDKPNSIPGATWRGHGEKVHETLTLTDEGRWVFQVPYVPVQDVTLAVAARWCNTAGITMRDIWAGLQRRLDRGIGAEIERRVNQN